MNPNAITIYELNSSPKNSTEAGSSNRRREQSKPLSDEDLQMLWLADPKRANRIIANRVAAARSKQKKDHELFDMKNKWRDLQMESATVSAELAKINREKLMLRAKNGEIRMKLQALAQRRGHFDSLIVRLSKDIEQLKCDISGKSSVQQPKQPPHQPLAAAADSGASSKTLQQIPKNWLGLSIGNGGVDLNKNDGASTSVTRGSAM